jgi:large subunit ribosomal protein L18
VRKDISEKKKEVKAKIRKRIRAKIAGTAARPRVYVFKSNRYVYAQAIDDGQHAVLAAACTLEKAFKEQGKSFINKDACGRLGEVLARRLKEKNIQKIVFDRGTTPYHGRVKTVAEALRKGGLDF